MILKLLNSPLILFSLISSLIIFLILYIWRKITGLESYVFILEKRLNNIKKDTLKKEKFVNSDEKPIDDLKNSDIIMNEVFNSMCSPTGCSINFPKYDTSTSFINLPVVNHTISKKKESVIPIELQEHIEEEKIISNKSINSQEVLPETLPETLSEILPEILPEVLPNVKKELNDDYLETGSTKSEILKTINLSGKKLLKLDLATLKEYCNKLNVSSEGTKNQIIERLLVSSQ